MRLCCALGGSVDGQLGVGKSDCNVKAALPLALPSADDSITHLSASLKHIIACTKGGVVLSAGANAAECLGRKPLKASSLRPIAALSTHVIRSVAAGENFSFALSDNGRLFAWGANAHGQLGLGDAQPRRRPRPVKFATAVRVRAIAAGTRHALCLTESGTAYAWGAAARGQIGHATCVSSSRPVLLEVLRGVALATSAACGDHSIVCTTSGRLYSWGSNAHGQLCLGDAVRMKHKCELVRCATSISAQHVSCGLHHTAVVSAAGAVLTAGSNSRGQLGRAASEPRERNRLMAVEGLREHGKAIGVACGDYHTLVLVQTPEGRSKVLSFGLGSCGQLGHAKREGAAARPHVVTPRPLVLPAALLEAAAGARRAARLWAGGNGSFVGIGGAGGVAQDDAGGAGSGVTSSR
jgi:alpha-tubulin suppressor-like RCC1 family protein